MSVADTREKKISLPRIEPRRERRVCQTLSLEGCLGWARKAPWTLGADSITAQIAGGKRRAGAGGPLGR